MYPNCNQGYAGFQPYNLLNPVPTAQMMQPQQPPVNNFLYGRTVSSPDDIKPNEVPMDGNLAIFPVNDGSAVYIKQWSTDGTIRTTEYKKTDENLPIKKEEEPIGWPELKTYLDEQFDKIEKRLRKEAKPNG